MKTGKRIVAILLVVLMLLTAAPLAGFIGLKIFPEAQAYNVGDTIQYGTYPQPRVDETSELQAAANDATWKSYDYYTGTGSTNDGKMTPSDYMTFADFFTGGTKYRAVKFTKYRQEWTGYQAGGSYTDQDDNGYEPDTTYYFKYQPLTWRVLDPSTGYIMCESIVDSQAYQNTIYYNGSAHYQAIDSSVYANDYATSSIRDWLNYDFYETAFTADQKDNIKTTALNNDAYNTTYNSAATNDKIFLLSWSDALNTSYGFSSSYSYDTARRAQGTDYAKCQGLRVSTSSSYNSQWWLRSPGNYSDYACDVDSDGYAYCSIYSSVSDTYRGVRPACCLNELKNDTSVSNRLFSRYNDYSDLETLRDCYSDVINAYKTIMDHNYYRGQDWPSDLSPYIAVEWLNSKQVSTANDTVSYTLYDVDYNGTPELLIADEFSNEEYVIYGIFSYLNGQIVEIANSCGWGYRTNGTVLSNSIIVEMGSSSAKDHSWSFYRISNSETDVINRIFCSTWNGEQYFLDNYDVEIRKEQADQICEELVGCGLYSIDLQSDISFDWKLIKSVPDYENGTITGTLESYLPQIDVENGGVWVVSVTIDGVTYPVQNRLLEDTLSGDIGKIVTVELTNGVVTDIKIHVGEAATGTCKIRSTSDSKDIEVPFEYWDDDFLQSSYIYNHNLSKMSLRLALSAFNSAEGHNYDKNDKSRNVQDLLEKCGFQSIKASDSYGEQPSADSIGVCLGSKEIGNSTLIAVAIRGGGYEAEWAGNFEIGGDATHHGFAIAATKVQTEILKYFEQHTDLLSKKLKFWIVGYSRAGATANLVSAWLSSKPVDWQLEKKDIYAYTFEAPQPTTLAKNNRDYDYIHNIVNPVDLVPKVVMSKWGYARYGKNMWLPSASTSFSFSLPAYAQAIQNQMDAYLRDGNYTDGHPMIPLNAAHGPVLDILADELASNLQDPNSDRTKLLSYLLQQQYLAKYTGDNDITQADVNTYIYALTIKHVVSTVIGKLIEGYSENKLIGAIAEKISDAIIQKLAYNPDVTDGIGVMAAKMFLRIAELYSFKPRMLTMYDKIYSLTETGKILANVGEIAACLMTPHFPELTLALLDSVDSLPEVCGYRIVKVNCPVDVYAYDENGNVVAQIFDEQSIEETNQMIYSYIDEDGQKTIFVPDDADFDIRVIARDSGIMNYSVSEYDCNTGKTTQLVNYNDIPIQKGDVFNGEVPVVESDTDTTYTLSSSTSDVDLTETVLKGDQIIDYTVIVNAEGEGYVSGNSLKKYGEFVLVNAIPDKNSVFTGWFKDGKLVSVDAEYRFRVDGDVTLTAKFQSHTHTYTSAVTTQPTCTKPGVRTYTCVDGDDSYTETIPAPGHVDKNNDGKCDACGTQMTGGDHCKYCGKIHGGAFGWLVKFFHNIFALFKRK